MTDHSYLASFIRDWLRAPSATALAERTTPDTDTAYGSDARRYRECEMTVHLWLDYVQPDVRQPLTPTSRQKLRALVANPDQLVCDWAVEDVPGVHTYATCPLVHVDPSAIANPAAVATAPAHDLRTDDTRAWIGPHAHGRITIYRDHAGDEWAVWSDGDPTKDGAWNISEPVDLDRARDLLGVTHVG